MRCSDKCIELVDRIRKQSVQLRQWLAPNNATRAEASALTDEAKVIRSQAKGVAEGSEAENQLLAKAEEIAKKMAGFEQQALKDAQTEAFNAIERVKNPAAGSDFSKALEAEKSLKGEVAAEAKRLGKEWEDTKTLAGNQMDDALRHEVGLNFGRLRKQAEALEARVLAHLPAVEEAGAIDYQSVAKGLGYETRFGADRAPFNSHGQEVFFDGNSYISRDIDSHLGGVWKKFDRAGNRVGTYNKDLTTKLGP